MNKQKNLGHIMLDLETLGTKDNSVISAIAAVEFDLKTGQTGRNFYGKIDLQSSFDSNRRIDADTIKWWFEQSKEAQNELFTDCKHLNIVLAEFSAFMMQFDNPLNLDFPQVWGNGISFDLGLLKNVYRYISTPVPWRFWQERDVRTLVSLNPIVKKAMPFKGTPHNPLDDCYHQIAYCMKTYQSIQISTEN